MDYWRGCNIPSTNNHFSRPLHVDHPDSHQRTDTNGRIKPDLHKNDPKESDLQGQKEAKRPPYEVRQ